jgi:3-oxoacyl-[acyl-carrier protein] reductase
MTVQRHAQPDEIAGMVAYVASPEAAFVTGASLTIDGGFNA